MAAVKDIGNGVVRVELDGRTETVYVAGPLHDRWVFWKGRVYRGDFRENRESPRTTGSHARILTAPMPATITRIDVHAGDSVTRGQVLMLLEAMKMELPVRAPQDAVVAAVHGRPGDLVQADVPLVEFEE